MSDGSTWHRTQHVHYNPDGTPRKSSANQARPRGRINCGDLGSDGDHLTEVGGSPAQLLEHLRFVEKCGPLSIKFGHCFVEEGGRTSSSLTAPGNIEAAFGCPNTSGDQEHGEPGMEVSTPRRRADGCGR